MRGPSAPAPTPHPPRTQHPAPTHPVAARVGALPEPTPPPSSPPTPHPPLLQPASARYRSFRIRFVSSIVLIASFLAIIWAGHVPLMFMILGIQVRPGLFARHGDAGRGPVQSAACMGLGM